MTESPAILTPDAELRRAVVAVRSHWRRRVLLEGGVAVLLAITSALLIDLLLTTVLGPAVATPLMLRVVGYLIIAGAVGWFVVRPALREVSDERIALYVEEHAPHLRQGFLSAVHALDGGEAEVTSPALATRLMRDALAAIESLEGGAAIERPRTRRAAGSALGVVALSGLLLALGPTALRDVARILFVPWATVAAAPVPALAVLPGNHTLPRGAAIDIRADLHGFTAAGADLVVRADTGDSWTRIPMIADSTGHAFVARLFDVTRNTRYFVEADGVRSPNSS